MHPRSTAEQPPSLRQWNRLGASFFMPHLHSRYVNSVKFMRIGHFFLPPIWNGIVSIHICCDVPPAALLVRDAPVMLYFVLNVSFYRWWPSSTHMGHTANATRYRGSHFGLYGCRRWNQPNPMGRHPTGLDRHLLPPFTGNPTSVTAPLVYRQKRPFNLPLTIGRWAVSSPGTIFFSLAGCVLVLHFDKWLC